METMNKEQVCTTLKIAPRTLEGWVKAGRFPPPVQIGKAVYWLDEAVQKWQVQTFKAQLEWKRRY